MICRLKRNPIGTLQVCAFAAVFGLTITAASAGAPAPSAGSGASNPVSTHAVNARDAGARYGQALGVLEICHGSTLTSKAKALGDTFTGADNDAFKAQAAKVYEAWHTVKNCAKQSDPNQCKIIMDKSCAAAETEIGPAGTAMSGLVEFMKR